MSEPRKTTLTVNYNGKNISEKINKYVEGFTYTDVATGESDSITLTLNNSSKKWNGLWMPEKGDSINTKIHLRNWVKSGRNKVFSCGRFTLDDLSFSGRPSLCEIGAVSIPQDDAFNSEKKTKTWNSVTVKGIAEEIASNASVSLYFGASDIPIGTLEQNSQTDCNFLYSLCKSYSLGMKVYSNKIIIFDEEEYEKKEPVVTLDETDFNNNWKYNTTIAGTYTGATMSYSDPTDNAEYIIDIGGGSRILEINESADSIDDAERKGIAKLNEENKKITTMTVRVKANPKIIASSTIKITGLNKLNGKYYVDKVKHSVGDAYTMTLTLRLVQTRIKTASVRAVETVVEEETGEGTQYTIQSGDTLWALAVKYLGSGIRYTEIYNLNQDIIESAAIARGKTSSSNGHWIYPGTTITIPAA